MPRLRSLLAHFIVSTEMFEGGGEIRWPRDRDRDRGERGRILSRDDIIKLALCVCGEVGVGLGGWGLEFVMEANIPAV